jgi:predicted lipoprotein
LDSTRAERALHELKREALQSFVDHFLIPTLTEFAAACDALVDACGADAEDPSPEKRASAQDAWRIVMDSWQRLEVVALGPAGAMGKVIGGMDLRDEIYSWPGGNPCRVDQETTEKVYEDAEAFKLEFVNVRGLDAIEQLVFVEGDGNDCAQNSNLNTSGAWAALSSEEIRQQRADYAATLAGIVQGHAGELKAAWEDGFGVALATAGEGSEIFSTAHDGLNSLTNALFYLDKVTKDMKLAEPSGVSECEKEACPGSLESLFAHQSKEHVRANLEAFRDVLAGGLVGAEGRFGILDLLQAVGAGDLSLKFESTLDAAILAVAGLEGSFLETIESDVEALRDLHGAVKEVTDLLKTDLLSTFDLELPQRAASDND